MLYLAGVLVSGIIHKILLHIVIINFRKEISGICYVQFFVTNQC